MYIHELKEWPSFVWDEKKLAPLLIEVRHQQGRLIGGMESIGFHIREETILDTLTEDVVKTSEIEGKLLDPALVRSSVARHLGMEAGALDSHDRNVDGVVEMVLDATQRYFTPLSEERLFGWHSLLFPTGRSGFIKIKTGQWRSVIAEVVSGQMGKEIIHFTAPKAEEVKGEMQGFLQWMNEEGDMDPVLKAAIAHLWFVTIHPFEDGNGRIGRAIVDLILSQCEKSSQRFYSLSSQIQRSRKGYYAILEKTQKGGLDITEWLEWFLHAMKKAIEISLTTLGKIIHKGQFWEELQKSSFNERQVKLINCLLEGFQGSLTSSKWAKIAKCSQDTAYRDICDLLSREILVKGEEGGRSTNYLLKDLSFDGEKAVVLSDSL